MAAAAAAAEVPDVPDAEATFSELGLDDRLQKAVSKLGWRLPTLIQTHVVKQALAGKDVLARARTGSGKTGAYALPMLHMVLGEKRRQQASRETLGLVLVPTKELSRQAGRNLKDMARFCGRDIKVVDVSGGKPQRAALRELPEVIVGTPSQVRAHIDAGHTTLSTTLRMLVIDEADLVFSYGYEDDLVALLAKLPPIRQNLLMSATLGSEVEALKKLVLRRPVILKLKEADLPGDEQLAQYSVHCTPDDKFLISYALLKLRLLRGKTLFFVDSVERCYKMKLFLEQFSIKACVLNSELPIQSRQHIVDQFNKGVYDYLIASDEGLRVTAPSKASGSGASGGGKRRKQDSEYGVSRGVDFRNVKNVVNIDFPSTAKSYVHRVGRTARGHDAGVALSMLSGSEDEAVLAEAQDLLRVEANGADTIKPYAFKMEAIDGLRYRVRDVLKSITKHAIRNARKREIRQEILNSEILKQHFAENPRDAEVLRHDTALASGKQTRQHLKHLPGYLVPKGTEAARGRKRKDISKYVRGSVAKGKRRKQSDPLKNLGKVK